MFKLFVCDVGIAGAMAELDPALVLDDAALLQWYRGMLAEQFACQQLISDLGMTPFYWTPRDSSAEADFVTQRFQDIYLVEVKGGAHLRSKSLSAIGRRFPWLRPVRLSPAGYRDQGWMRNIPLWAMGSWPLWSRRWPEPGDDAVTASTAPGSSAPPSRWQPTQRQRALVSLLKDDPEADYETLAERLGVGRATVARDLSALKGAGMVRREGSARSGRWIVSSAREEEGSGVAHGIVLAKNDLAFGGDEGSGVRATRIMDSP